MQVGGLADLTNLTCTVTASAQSAPATALKGFLTSRMHLCEGGAQWNGFEFAKPFKGQRLGHMTDIASFWSMMMIPPSIGGLLSVSSASA